jgi:hypothetical protein
VIMVSLFVLIGCCNSITILGYIKDLLSELVEVHRTGGNKGQTRPGVPRFLSTK